MWEAVSSLNETLNFVDNSGGSSGDVGASSIAAVRTVGSVDGRHYHITNMGSVKSRALTSADANLVDENNVVACTSSASSNNYQQHHQHHHQIKNYCGNGSGFLHKNDLRYDIGGNSQYHPVRQPSVRSRSQQPMPTAEELDRRFTKVLVSTYLPYLKFFNNFFFDKLLELLSENRCISYVSHNIGSQWSIHILSILTHQYISEIRCGS